MASENFKIFISWSGSPSREVAILLESYLKIWIPFPNVEWFLSSSTESGIESGDRFMRTLDKNLQESDFGILVLTKNNIDSPWILFEAGAISKNVEISKVVPFLINRDINDIEKPLNSFHYVDLEEDKILKLIITITKYIFSGKEISVELKIQLENKLRNTWEKFISSINQCINDNTNKIDEITKDVKSFMMDESAYEQILSKRETHLKELIDSLDQNNEKRIIIVGGISTTLRSEETIKKLSIWLINNPGSNLFICHENVEVAEQRARDLRDNLFEEPEQKSEEIRRRKVDEFQRMKSHLLETIGDRISKNLHFIEITKPLSVYITVSGNIVYLTPVLDKRSSDTFTFKLTQTSLLIEVLDYISSRFADSQDNKLLLEEIESIKNENNEQIN